MPLVGPDLVPPNSGCSTSAGRVRAPSAHRYPGWDARVLQPDGKRVPQVVRAVRAEVGAVGVGAGDGAVVDPAEVVTGQDCTSARGPLPPPAIGLPTIGRQRMGVF